MQAPVSRILIVFLVSVLLAGAGYADSAEAAAARIKDRLPAIDQLKEEGKVGETHEGFLASRKDLGPRQQSLVDAENKDRRIIYSAVAERTEQSVEEVGKQRAIRIAEQAQPGIWLLKPDGEWYQKP